MSAPALRFKQDDGQNFPEWKKMSLAEFLVPDFRQVDKPQDSYLSIGIRSHCKGTFQKPEADPNKNSMDKLFVVHEGDLIVNITFAWEGAIAIVKKVDHGGYVSHRFPTYRFKPEITSPEFFQYVFVQPKFRTTLELISPGGAGRNRVLSKNEFLKITSRLPSKQEQIKITNFLMAVDEKITQLNEKYDLISQYKKGVMQKIFNQELQFKNDDGRDFPKWNYSTLGDVANFIKDGTHGTHSEAPDSQYYLLSAKNINNGRITYDDSDRRISKEEFDGIYRNYNLQENDVLLTVVGSIGRVAKYSDKFKNVAFQRSVAFFRFPKENSDFMVQIFNTENFQNALLKNQVVSAQPGIYLGDLAKINVPIPSVNEQTKIANFLNAIDDKITATRTQLEVVKQYRQCLLQQMFV